VKDFESNIDHCVSLFLGQLAEQTKLNGHVTLDMSLWLHLYAFDCLTAVNLSKPLGFLDAGDDVKSMIGSADRIFVLVGLVCCFASSQKHRADEYISSLKHPLFIGYWAGSDHYLQRKSQNLH
jgi:hypothetical protein